MNKSSLVYWFPKIKGLGIPVPKTEIVPLTPEEIQTYHKCKEDTVFFSRLNEQVRRAIQERFQLPVFLKTDEYSNKHGWKETCFLNDLRNLDRNLAKIIEGSLTVDFLGPLPIEAMVVREFIPMKTGFHAFRGEMPVNPERRYFILNGRVECHHPYWIEDAVVKGTGKEKLPENWRHLAKSMNYESPEEIAILTGYAQRVARVMPEHWSIDFCKSLLKGWILIDMAEGDKSWHPSTCQYSSMPEESKEKPDFKLEKRE